MATEEMPPPTRDESAPRFVVEAKGRSSMLLADIFQSYFGPRKALVAESLPLQCVGCARPAGAEQTSISPSPAEPGSQSPAAATPDSESGWPEACSIARKVGVEPCRPRSVSSSARRASVCLTGVPVLVPWGSNPAGCRSAATEGSCLRRALPVRSPSAHVPIASEPRFHTQCDLPRAAQGSCSHREGRHERSRGRRAADPAAHRGVNRRISRSRVGESDRQNFQHARCCRDGASPRKSKKSMSAQPQFPSISP